MNELRGVFGLIVIVFGIILGVLAILMPLIIYFIGRNVNKIAKFQEVQVEYMKYIADKLNDFKSE